MTRIFWALIVITSSLCADFIEVTSFEHLQSILKANKSCVIAIGMDPCIPCEKIKHVLLTEQKQLPNIFWIDLKKHPKIRHVFNFKAVPYMAVYENGELKTSMTGERGCREYLLNSKY